MINNKEAWMVTDQQVRRLMLLMQTSKSLSSSAAKAEMDEKTARKYLDLGKLPSEIKKEHNWRTRKDPFTEDWDQIRDMLNLTPGLEAKTIFQYLQREYPGKYQDGQLRTLQRRVKVWRALEGPSKEIFFPQEYHPGISCESDFTSMNKLGITIHGQPFKHLIFHFVLPYSNWEAGTICFSESFEALSFGLQNSLWELGGVPRVHQTDRLSTAVNNMTNPAEFTQRYEGLLNHYKLKGQKINAGQAHENGDIEQRHNRYKRAVDQALMLRGSRNFDSRTEYNCFLKKLFTQLNAGRRVRFAEELEKLRRLPLTRLDCGKRITVRVRNSSTIHINKNIYSVHSRLIGENVHVRLYPEYLEVWYAQRRIDKIPRFFGTGKHHIQYRHIIDWLVRKPGAFQNYRYQDALFPTHRFRMAYDFLDQKPSRKADMEYLKILHLAAKESEAAVDQALDYMFNNDLSITFENVDTHVKSEQKFDIYQDVNVDYVDISVYDTLLDERSMMQ
jgi:hypothetical protein